jgi:NAD(P) transhydrogenase subunit alpha
MKIFVPRESESSETRIPLVPDSAQKLVGLGAPVEIESDLGADLGYPDEAYEKAGAAVSKDRQGAMSAADIVIRLRKPPLEDVSLLKKGAIHISYLDPFRERDLVGRIAEQGISAICIELVPRTTLAQKMDALSSQASLGGYVAVILAADRLKSIFPMMMTPAGTIVPARVFVIGAGVAGLQAIATAKRLGARVEAYDTRPVVEEQVKSLGAKFVKIDVGETGQTKDGYAKQLTEEQLQMQRDAMAKFCAAADVVITTAQVFGRPAPRILSAEMVAGMKPGSVVVDMAAETGGNVEGSKVDEEVVVNGIRILGFGNLPGRVPVAASQVYSNNVCNLLEHFWDKESESLKLDMEDEIMQGCLLTHEGQILNENVKGA